MPGVFLESTPATTNMLSGAQQQYFGAEFFNPSSTGQDFYAQSTMMGYPGDDVAPFYSNTDMAATAELFRGKRLFKKIEIRFLGTT